VRVARGGAQRAAGENRQPGWVRPAIRRLWLRHGPGNTGAPARFDLSADSFASGSRTWQCYRYRVFENDRAAAATWIWKSS